MSGLGAAILLSVSFFGLFSSEPGDTAENAMGNEIATGNIITSDSTDETTAGEGTKTLHLGDTQLNMPDEITPGCVNVFSEGSVVSYRNPEENVEVSYSDSYIKSGDQYRTNNWAKHWDHGEVTQYTIHNKTTVVVIDSDKETKTWDVLQDIGAENCIVMHIEAPLDTYTDAQALDLFSQAIQHK